MNSYPGENIFPLLITARLAAKFKELNSPFYQFLLITSCMYYMKFPLGGGGEKKVKARRLNFGVLWAHTACSV
jgi:hypothetical protein